MCKTTKFTNERCIQCGCLLKEGQTECYGCRCVDLTIKNEGNTSKNRKKRAKKHLKNVSIPTRRWVKKALRHD